MSDKELERRIYIVGLVAGVFAITSGVGMMVTIIFY
jgi:hypothetical protein